MTIGIFGGSFNPVHLGHVGVAKRAIADLGLDSLIVIPAAVSPFKAGSAPSPYDRLALVKAAFADVPKTVVDDRELRRGGVSYAIDTVREIAAENPGAKLVFLVGEDSLEGLPKWKDHDELVKLCTFVSFPRTRESSTEVRRRLAAGESVDDLVPPAVAAMLSLRPAACISPHVRELIDAGSEAVRRQFVPDVRELESSGDLLEDPLGEERLSPVANIVHKYPDHCLFFVSNRCAANCRFCTRKRMFGAEDRIDASNLEPGFRYIEEHREIRDVLLSGGDPLLLEDAELEEILRRLRAIGHVEIIRIGTRIPFSLPERVTTKLAGMLKRYHPLYVNVHFNHPDELDAKTCAALAKLADAGIPLGSQTVLLKGVNDSVETMKALMNKLLACRVRPYYIFQCDQVFGTEHFRTPLSKGLEIMKGLRCWTSGLAVPAFAIDLPRGGGKVQLVPDSLVRKEGRTFVFRNFLGEEYEYRDVPEL